VFVSSIIDAIARVLDIPDDILEWLSSQLKSSFHLIDLVGQLVINLFASMVPFYQFEDPFPIIDDTSGLLPVLVPVENVAALVNDDEFVMSADIG
jgi:hypothetical protein